MKRAELLAPAGDYTTLIGAVNAGADAVYLAGQQYGARAYANNFTDEELMDALHFAHLHHCKIYLTLNTLVKEREFDGLDAFLAPLYEHGLDGIIVQDLGVMRYLRRRFPLLPLHVSTQAAIANADAAAMFGELGAVRIVPARELGLTEIRQIKEQTGLEVETFIHGAICYCYSGMCLFSSILGGRSGNRGRCAQPCRLPYRYENNSQEQYLLSLKDMCTIEILDEILDAGIDSLKIEGRMKSPEYAAGVCSIYRKYMDRYAAHPGETFSVSRQDLDMLGSLYVRKSLQTGYYRKRSGRDMITLEEPGYLPTDEAIRSDIRERFLDAEQKIPITMTVSLHVGADAVLVLTEPDSRHSVTVTGETVSAAQKNPIDSELVRKQLRKLGNTLFITRDADITVEMEEGCFLGVKALNELRRAGIELLEHELLAQYGRSLPEPVPSENSCAKEDSALRIKRTEVAPRLSVLCTTMEQLERCRHYSSVHRIYLDYVLYEHLDPGVTSDAEWFVALPHILRQDKTERFRNLVQTIQNDARIQGVLIRDHGEYRICSEQTALCCVADSNLYAMNREAISALYEIGYREFTYPYELNRYELADLSDCSGEMIVYSHIPLMCSANCVRKTMGECNGADQGCSIVDRRNKRMDIRTCCDHCYNVIYNSVPYSLHGRTKELDRLMLQRRRIELYHETGEETQAILDAFCIGTPLDAAPEYTNGHFNRGVQ